MSNLLPFEAYYENTRGERLMLSEPPYVMTDGRLFDSRWTMTTVSRPLGEGIRLLRSRRPVEERTAVVQVLADSPPQLSERLVRMAEIFDYDVENLSPGRLWINGQYMSCWCSAREKALSGDFSSRAAVTLSVFPETPVWCREQTCELISPQADGSGHSYPFRYSYRYGSGRRAAKLVNTHYAACPLRLTFHGPAVNPGIYINGTRIGVNITLDDGESAVIDQQTRQVYRMDANGKRTGCFDLRTKNGYVFEFAPSGESPAVPDSTGNIDIVLIEQRSEPLWALS